MPEFIEISQDQDGIIPVNIRKICEERRDSGKPMPKVSCRENWKSRDNLLVYYYVLPYSDIKKDELVS